MIFGPERITTGASNDIERATALARNMVTKYGMSEKLGPLSYTEDEGEVFLGRSVTQHKSVSDETAMTIDREIRTLIDINYQTAKKILEENMAKLHAMAEALLKYETLDMHQLKRIMNNEAPGDPEGWNDGKPPAPPSPVTDKSKPTVSGVPKPGTV